MPSSSSSTGSCSFSPACGHLSSNCSVPVSPFLSYMIIPISIHHATMVLIFKTKRNFSRNLFLILHSSLSAFFCCSSSIAKLLKSIVYTCSLCLLSCHSCLRWLQTCSAPVKVTTCADVSDVWHSCSHSSFWNTVYLALEHHSLPFPLLWQWPFLAPPHLIFPGVLGPRDVQRQSCMPYLPASRAILSTSEVEMSY